MNAERLKEIRRRQKLKQDEFAKKLGVSKKTVANWEKGAPPSLENFKTICMRSHTSADYLLDLDDDEKKLDISDFSKEDRTAIIAMVQAFRAAKQGYNKNHQGGEQNQ